MGFYDSSQLVRDARQHGVEIRPIDVNASAWDCTLEPTDGKRCAVRLGLRMTRGLAERDGQRLAAARQGKPYASVLELAHRAHSGSGALVRLAKVDAFRSMELGRRDAAWAIKALRDDPLPLCAAADAREQTICDQADKCHRQPASARRLHTGQTDASANRGWSATAVRSRSAA